MSLTLTLTLTPTLPLASFLASIGRDVDWLAESLLAQVRGAGFTGTLDGSLARRGLLQAAALTLTLT